VLPEGFPVPDDGPVPHLAVDGERLAVGDRVRIAVRPERVWVLPADVPAPTPHGARLAGTVSGVNYLGAVTQIAVAVPGGPTVLTQGTSDGRLAGLAEGARVHVGWTPDAAFVLPRDDP